MTHASFKLQPWVNWFGSDLWPCTLEVIKRRFVGWIIITASIIIAVNWVMGSPNDVHMLILEPVTGTDWEVFYTDSNPWLLRKKIKSAPTWSPQSQVNSCGVLGFAHGPVIVCGLKVSHKPLPQSEKGTAEGLDTGTRRSRGQLTVFTPHSLLGPYSFSALMSSFWHFSCFMVFC